MKSSLNSMNSTIFDGFSGADHGFMLSEAAHVGLLPEQVPWSQEAGCRSHGNFLGVQKLILITLWLFNIAMENGPFIDGLPGFTY